jgi:hypothetical protein
MDFRQSRSGCCRDFGGTVADEVAIGPIVFRHEPTGAPGEIAGHLHPEGAGLDPRTFGRTAVLCQRRGAGGDAGVRGLYRGLEHPRRGFRAIFQTLAFTAHVLGDRRVHSIAASRCY